MEIIELEKQELKPEEIEKVSGGVGAYVEPPEEPGDGWKKMKIRCFEGGNRSVYCRHCPTIQDYLGTAMITGLPDATCHMFRCPRCRTEYAKYMINADGIWYERMPCGG